MSNRFQLISKGDSLIIKGVAVLLMLWHHLFGDPTRWPENSKIVWTFPWEWFKGSDPVAAGHSRTGLMTFVNHPETIYFDVFTAFQCSMTVSLFMLVTGFGLGGTKEWRPHWLAWDVFKRARVFYRIYLPSMVLALLCIFLFPPAYHSVGGEVKDWSLSFCWHNVLYPLNPGGFNGEWWYARTFILSLLYVYPICALLNALGRWGQWGIASLTVWILYLVFSKAPVPGFMEEVAADGTMAYWGIFGLGFLLRILQDEGKLEFMRKVVSVDHRFAWLKVMVIVVASCLLWWRIANPFIQATIPLAVGSVMLTKLVRLEGVMMLLGKYSGLMWLNHSFLCYFFLKDQIYGLRYAPLCMLALVVLSLGLAWVTAKLTDWVCLGCMYVWRKVFPKKAKAQG